MRLGIDFGTTNSAIALSNGADICVFKVEEDLPDLLPSLIYITRRFRRHVGSTARDTYLEQNTDRPSKLVLVYVGETEITVAGAGSSPIIYIQPLYAEVDVLSPGRLLQSVKTALRDKTYEGTQIFERYYSIEQLIAILFEGLLRSVEPRLEQKVTSVVVGRPVKFSDDPETDQAAEAKIRAGARQAGIEEVIFVPEPIGAAYAHHASMTERKLAMIFDFGGGTLDLTVAHLGGPQMPEILSTEGVLIGGDDFDKRIMQHLLKYFGEGVTTEKGVAFSLNILNQLLDWQTAINLNRPQFLHPIKTATLPWGSSDPEKIKALETLVTRNLVYKLFQQIQKAKQELSKNEKVMLEFVADNIIINETISRRQFEVMIHEEYLTISRAIDKVVKDAGLTHDQIDLVVRTGGSSQIPHFINLLSEKFGAEKVMGKEGQVMTGVVQGLSLYAYHQDIKEKQKVVEANNLRSLMNKPFAEIDLNQKEDQATQFIVGIDHKYQVYLTPWIANLTVDPALAPRLQQGIFANRSGRVLVTTNFGRFMLLHTSDLADSILNEGKLPEYMIIRNGEHFAEVHPWRRSSTSQSAILVSYLGGVRVVNFSLMAKKLEEEGEIQPTIGSEYGKFIRVLSGQPESEIALASTAGRVIRVAANRVPLRGGAGLKITPNQQRKGEHIVDSLVIDDTTHLVLVDQQSMGVYCEVAELPLATKSSQSGKAILQRRAICGLLSGDDNQQAFGLTNFGRVIELDLKIAKEQGRKKPMVELQAEELLVNCWNITRLTDLSNDAL